MKPEILEVSKTWARFDWGDFPEVLPEGIERIDVSALKLDGKPLAEKLSPLCPICDTPLVVLYYPPTKKHPTNGLMCACKPCNLGVGSDYSFYRRTPKQDEAYQAIRVGELIYAYGTLVKSIEADIPKYVTERNAEINKKLAERAAAKESAA